MNPILTEQHKKRVLRIQALEMERMELDARLRVIRYELSRIADQELQAAERNMHPSYHTMVPR